MKAFTFGQTMRLMFFRVIQPWSCEISSITALCVVSIVCGGGEGVVLLSNYYSVKYVPMGYILSSKAGN